MLDLNNSKWKELKGGYRIPYDVSIPLIKLEKATNEDEINAIFKELWNDLHHQGDVDIASYYAVPHLIRIADEKKLHDYNAIGLITVIEIERHSDNPELPEELKAEYVYYIQKKLPELIKQIISTDCDNSLTVVLSAALAVSKGHIQLANAILKMEDESTLNEFLENY